MNIDWKVKHFKDLTVFELYALLRLRSEVFVVEQNCVYLDADNIDPHCYHVLGSAENGLVACTRLVPPSVIYPEISIGRVVTATSVRRFGIGKQLMQQSINAAYELFGSAKIKIGAQQYLQKFYESFGFNRISDEYLEDGIPHIYMMKSVSS